MVPQFTKFAKFCRRQFLKLLTLISIWQKVNFTANAHHVSPLKLSKRLKMFQSYIKKKFKENLQMVIFSASLERVCAPEFLTAGIYNLRIYGLRSQNQFLRLSLLREKFDESSRNIDFLLNVSNFSGIQILKNLDRRHEKRRENVTVKHRGRIRVLNPGVGNI